MSDDAPGKLEAWAAALAGVAFAAGALLLRKATVVPAGLFDGIALVLVSWGLSLFVHRSIGHATATLARGLGLAAGALIMTTSLLPPFDRAALPLAAWIGGTSCLQASTRTRSWKLSLAASGIALLVIGAALGWIASALWPESARLRGALIVAACLATAGLLTRILVARKHPRLAPSPGGVIIFAVLAASYVAYRALVATRVANLPLYEWTLGAGAAVLMLGRLRSSARDAAVDEAWTGKGQKHRQDALPAYDPRMAALAADLQRYLDTGEGFDDYRDTMLRLATDAPSHFRKTLQGARPVQGRGRAGQAARRERLVTHDALMEILHGHPEPHVHTHP
jgi:hypothetical protein